MTAPDDDPSAALQAEIGALRGQREMLLAEKASLVAQLAAARDAAAAAQERQTATADVLKITANSPTDVQPVLDALVEAAVRFCGASDATISLRDGDEIVRKAHKGPLSADVGARRPLDGDSASARAIRLCRTVHYEDIETLDPVEFAAAHERAARDGYRAALAAPMVRDGVAIGNIALRKVEAGGFAPQQIALIETFAAQAVLAIENVRLFNDLRESLERQTATADILKVIAKSPADMKPAFDAIAESANRLLGGLSTTVWRLEGEAYHLEAFTPTSEEADRALRAMTVLPKEQGDTLAPAAAGRSITEIPDTESGPLFMREIARLRGFRACLAASLAIEGRSIGFVNVTRGEPGVFRPADVELLKTFADQAVIAIQNARLFSELRDALEQQTATAEILRVISQSPTDVQPVLDAVAKAALRFCGAPDAVVWLRDGDDNVVVAHEGVLTASIGLRRPMAAALLSGQAMLEGRTRQIADVDALDTAAYAGVLALARQHKWRASAAAPMMHGGKAIGCVVLRKPEPGLLSPSQIALLETFAAQAVIAIENVRLFTELREALDQQSATADVLKVIASSPTDVQPVLDAVAKAAVRFCGATDATILLRDGDVLIPSAHVGPLTYEAGSRRPLDRSSVAGRATVDGRTFHVPDADALDPVEFAVTRRLAREHGFGAAVATPLRREDTAIGTIILRNVEPGPFAPQQIQLLETFAAQAVIAIQNVRLFSELNESLDQQTATAEVLRVISQSPTDVKPVLKAVAAAARRFCNAHTVGVILRDGAGLYAAATDGPLDVGPRRFPLDRGTVMGRSILDGRSVHVPDLQLADPDEYPLGRTLSVELGHRSIMAAPLLSEGAAIGCILLRKPEPDGFTARQIELAETFAAQAIIAIQNVRLFTELRDSLDRLKAAQANLIQAEKMASLGQLTAGIAHEIKNPLNFVNNFAGLSSELLEELKQAVDALLAEPDDDKRAELQDTMDLLTGNLAKILEHGRRADGIVKSMLAHSRGGTGDWQTSNINRLVEEALNLAYHGARAQDQSFNVTLERDFVDAPAPIDVVPQDVTRVFLNLFSNGFYATRKRQREGGDEAYRPALRVSTRDFGEAIEIRVHDNGIGIAPDVRDKLFEPFFTTKPTGEGTGLGLSISYDIVTQQHGGSIEVESEPGQYSEFIVRLPRRSAVRAEGRR